MNSIETSTVCIILIICVIYIFFTYTKIYEYKVVEIPNILSNAECDQLIAFSKGEMKQSDVLNYGESPRQIDENHRKSKHAWFSDDSHPIIEKIAKYTANISGLPIENQENIQVVKYEKGGKFNAHYDACIYEDKTFCNKINKKAGERKLTLIIYLNDDFEGGETEFPELKLKIKPVKGKGILFHNTDDNQVIHKKSIHKGNEVLGEKWICNKWVHFGKWV
jgi:prolyl 4-hydroxylase